MAKKVLMINSSFRKKNTYGLLTQIGRILKSQGIDVDILNLFDYEIQDCVGCETCIYQNDKCCMSDDMPLLMKKIMDSDGIVFSSPIYMRSATSKFKTFADRTCSWFHKPEPFGKPVLFVTTTASTGIGEIKKFFEGFAIGFGARLGGFISRKENELTSKLISANEVSRFITLIKQDKKEYSPTMNEIVIFEVQKVLASKNGKKDKIFWEQNDWIDKPYYYKCKMGLFKKMFSKMMFKILSKAIS